MEIERKFLLEQLPRDLNSIESHRITQAYISDDPVIRLRQMDDQYILTVKGRGFLTREEFELPLSEEAFARLLTKTEGRVIQPEETEALNSFVDRVEKRKTAKVHFTVADMLKILGRKKLSQAEIEALQIKESGLPAHVCEILTANGCETFNDVYEMMKNNPDAMFKLQGITSDDLNDISRIVTFVGKNKSAAEEPEQVIETEPEPAAEPEPIEEPEFIEEPEQVIEPEPEPVEEPVEMPEEPVLDLPEDQELSMEDIFNSVSSGLMKMSDYDDDDDLKMDSGYSKPSKKKKKKKGIEIEYDPDSDSTMVRRKHKRGDDDWGW